MCHDDRFFELVDTGGMGIADMDNLTRHIEEQISLAIDSADLILFVVDTREGMLPLDQEVARRLRSVQFPVILIPLGSDHSPDSIVLRPVDSVDGMTAQSVLMKAALREDITTELLHVEGIAGVFYDLTHKPPGTIEWE